MTEHHSSAATTAPLLPCPFCGGTALDDRGDNAIACTNLDCEAMIDIGHAVGAKARADRTARWNRRVTGAAQQAPTAPMTSGDIYNFLRERMEDETSASLAIACRALSDHLRVIAATTPVQCSSAGSDPVLWICLVGEDGRKMIRAWTADKLRAEQLRLEGLDMQSLYLHPAPQGAWWSPEELQRAKSALSNIAITHGYKLSDVELSEGVRAIARALAVSRPHGATPSAPDASAPAQRPRE